MLRLAPLIDGDDAADTIVFIQGWPDDASLWDDAVSVLRGSYRCVRTTLPNFGSDRTARWGYGTSEIVDALAGLIRGAGRGAPVTLVLHDWGCYWGYAVHHRHPELVSRVAGVDVAPHYEPAFGATMGIAAYQGWLLAAFGLGGTVGRAMTRAFAKLAHAPGDLSRLSASMNYPYRNFFADKLAGRDRALTGGYWPACPLLFVYGEQKPFPFHSANWVDHVRAVGGTVVGLPCGHWVPRDPAFAGVLESWLKASPPRPP